MEDIVKEVLIALISGALGATAGAVITFNVMVDKSKKNVVKDIKTKGKNSPVFANDGNAKMNVKGNKK